MKLWARRRECHRLVLLRHEPVERCLRERAHASPRHEKLCRCLGYPRALASGWSALVPARRRPGRGAASSRPTSRRPSFGPALSRLVGSRATWGACVSSSRDAPLRAPRCRRRCRPGLGLRPRMPPAGEPHTGRIPCPARGTMQRPTPSLGIRSSSLRAPSARSTATTTAASRVATPLRGLPRRPPGQVRGWRVLREHGRLL